MGYRISTRSRTEIRPWSWGVNGMGMGRQPASEEVSMVTGWGGQVKERTLRERDGNKEHKKGSLAVMVWRERRKKIKCTDGSICIGRWYRHHGDLGGLSK